MVRLIFWFAVLAGVTYGVTWLADSPGQVAVTIAGTVYAVSLGIGALGLGIAFIVVWTIWGIFKWIIGRPSAFGGFFSRRREKKGRLALSTGLLAIGAGDDETARKAAVMAGRLLPDDPLAQLLSAQSAQQQGDSARVKQVYREMANAPDTKLLGLRGLFNEARREKNIDAAREIANQALAENAGASWASNAMLVSYAADKDWPAVLLLLDNQLKAKIIDKETAQRKKAVVLTAQALEVEDADADAALDLATKAHKLDPSLVPAAVVAGRTNSSVGSLRKASRILETTWSLSPHPDIAEVYAHARPGDSAKDRQLRVKALLRMHHGGKEGAIATSVAAIAAQDWKTARETLNPLVNDQPSVRICTLMAEIETGEFGDKGRAREWLARAVHAPRDPAWTAQGFVSPQWLPVSPITGELGVFKWKVPVQGLAFTESQRQQATAPFLIADEVEEVEDIAGETGQSQEDEIITIEPEEVEMVKESDGEKLESENPETPPSKQTQVKTADEKPHRLPDDPGPKKPENGKSGESWFG